MLSLGSPRWSDLRHAYGSAFDMPELLRQLSSLPTAENGKETWESLWSALAHQGDVYDASFAAVPHVIHAIASAPEKAEFSYFQFPAWVEICRKKTGVEIPADIEAAYFDSLARLPMLVAAASSREWSDGFLCCALAAIVAAKGQAGVAEVALELDAKVAEEFMECFLES